MNELFMYLMIISYKTYEANQSETTDMIDVVMYICLHVICHNGIVQQVANAFQWQLGACGFCFVVIASSHPHPQLLYGLCKHLIWIQVCCN